jgi:hypothetical protein
MHSSGAITPWKMIGQSSPYNMHISMIWSFFVSSFIKIPKKGLGGVAKTKWKGQKEGQTDDSSIA